MNENQNSDANSRSGGEITKGVNPGTTYRTKVEMDDVFHLEKKPTRRTIEKEELLALIQIVVPVFACYCLNLVYQAWQASVILAICVTIVFLLVYPTFRAMRNLAAYRKIALPFFTQWKYLGQALELDENDNIVRVRIVYICPTCKSHLIEEDSAYGKRLTCTKDKTHKFVVDYREDK